MVDLISIITGQIAGFVSNATVHFAELPATEAIIFDIALILIISAILAFIARILRQPLIPAYVIAGLLIGPVVFGLIRNTELIYAFSEIGIAFLLFTAGLEISFKKIKEANLKKIIFIGLLQILAVFGISILLSDFLGLTTMQAVYLGIIMAFGSTMVVIKLLSDSGELVTMHGRLVLGILLLQDLVAIFAIAIFMSGSLAITPVVVAIIKLIAILFIAIVLQKFVLNPLFRFAARSTEVLLLSALAVLFLFIMMTYFTNLSIVIGAFIAGVSLANSPFKIELESRISPLRDFFSILFFVALGMQVVFFGLKIRLLLLLLGVAFLAKPIITLFLLRIFGYRPKTAFLTSISLAQLSEFSLIIGMLGLSLGVLDLPIFSSVILATIISMSVTTYFVKYKNRIYNVMQKPIRIFKWLPIKENLEYIDKEKKTILLVGAHRMGSILLRDLIEKKKKKLIVIDYNPEIVSALRKKKVSVIYGDLGSPELLEHVDICKLKMVISTAPNLDDGVVLLKKVKQANSKITVILTANSIDDALDLYEKGADYIIVPKVIAGRELTRIIHDEKSDLRKERQEHIKKLKQAHNILY